MSMSRLGTGMGAALVAALALGLAAGGCSSAARQDLAATGAAPQAREGHGGLPPAARSEAASSTPRAPAAEPAPGPPLPALAESDEGLDDYLREAVLNNPGLAAAESRRKAALERIPQVRTLPDPVVAYELWAFSDSQMHMPMVSQTFPWFGKLDLRAAVAREEAEAARRRYEDRRLRLVNDIKNAYYEYYYLGRAIAVVRENRDLLTYLETVLRTRYAAMAAVHADVIRAQVELGKLDDQVRSLQDRRGPVMARLNASLNRPAGTVLPWPKAVAYEPLGASDDEVLGWVPESSPDLRAMDHEALAARRAVDLAGKDYYPDFILGLGYMREEVSGDGGRDGVKVMAGITLPIWRQKYAAGVREAEARHAGAVQAKADRANTLASMAKEALYQTRDAQRKIDLYQNTLMPKARESLKATQTALQAGKATFTDLIDAQRVLLEFQLEYERSLANHGQRLAELEVLVGRPIPRSAPPVPAPEPTPAQAAPAAPPAPTEPLTPKPAAAPPPAPPPVPIERGPAPQPPPFGLEPPAAPSPPAPPETQEQPRPEKTGTEPAKGEGL